MTIEEFMRDIAPKMRPGWVAMDEGGTWYWYEKKPEEEPYYFNAEYGSHAQLKMFNIEPVDDWRKSLRKVGNKWHI